MGKTVAAPAAVKGKAGTGPLRLPEEAVKAADRYNGNLHLSAEDLERKIALMRSSPHIFLRCMPALFYQDVQGPYAGLSNLLSRPCPTGPIAGDCHLGNFGTYRVGADGNVVWGVNDYDMADRNGRPEWDLERLGTSVLLQAQAMGLSQEQRQKLIDAVAEGYAKGIKHGCGSPWIAQNDAHGEVKKVIEQANEVKRHEWIKKYAVQDKAGDWRIVESKDLKPVTLETERLLQQGIDDWGSRLGEVPHVKQPLKVYGFAQKLDSGGSSFGMPRYYALVAADHPDKPPRIIEMKQELPSPLVDPTGNLNHADAAALVKTETSMGARYSPLIGYAHVPWSSGTSWLMREREPCKATVDLTQVKSFDQLLALSQQCATVLARLHCNPPGMAQKMQTWLGDDEKTLAQSLFTFCHAYEGQTDEDWKAFVAAHPGNPAHKAVSAE
ncbi:MAG: DUF2252 family protein [Candidatus Xenobia bacterium]